MIIGQEFPIRVQVLTEPPIDLTTPDTAIYVRVTNNKVNKFTYGPGQASGEVNIETDIDGNKTWAVCEGITRAQSLTLNPGRIVIELLLKTPDPAYPEGFHTIVKFYEPVEESSTTDISTV